MTAPTPGTEARINAFYDQHGNAWGIIEESGMEREHHTGALFATLGAAHDYKVKQYDADEVESMNVALARWDREGEFWTYDY